MSAEVILKGHSWFVTGHIVVFFVSILLRTLGMSHWKSLINGQANPITIATRG